jgi:4-carboxymuconolactone decarboxylase
LSTGSQDDAKGEEPAFEWPYDQEYESVYMSVVRRPPGPPTPFREITVEMISKVWGRPGLSLRERRLIVITLLAAAGQLVELDRHVRAAIDAGDLSSAELDEVALQIAMYAGWPSGVAVQNTLREVAKHPGLSRPPE